MANPWLKKNPFLSVWLSGVNSVAGSVRSRVMQRARRQGAAAMRAAPKTIMDAWTAAVLAPPARKRKRRSR